jgi:hypothetical protein
MFYFGTPMKNTLPILFILLFSHTIVPMNAPELPNELWQSIINALDKKDAKSIIAARSVCSAWKEFAEPKIKEAQEYYYFKNPQATPLLRNFKNNTDLQQQLAKDFSPKDIERLHRTIISENMHLICQDGIIRYERIKTSPNFVPFFTIHKSKNHKYSFKISLYPKHTSVLKNTDAHDNDLIKRLGRNCSWYDL